MSEFSCNTCLDRDDRGEFFVEYVGRWDGTAHYLRTRPEHFTDRPLFDLRYEQSHRRPRV